jgi:hypothetical protein
MQPVSVKPTLKTLISHGKVVAALMLLPLLLATPSNGQGTTLTVTFDGGQVGGHTQAGADPFSDVSGMQVGGLTPQSLYLTGGGIPGYPDNGTSYLEIPAGGVRLGFNTFPPGVAVPFSLLSFDAAEYDSAGPKTLTFVGYVFPEVMGSQSFVTNVFTVSSQTFQTFRLDSAFGSVYQVDVLNASWSLDNLVISGVPEPSAAALASVAAACALVRRHRQRKSHAP